MIREELIFVATCDIAGQVRGKGFPASELPGRQDSGVGWTHSNLMQTAFGPILDTPFGTGGDLMIVPDPSARARVDFEDGSAPEHFILGDIRNTDASPWECCPRDFLRRAIADLDAAAGLHVLAAFEQEFVYTGVPDRPGNAYSLGAFRQQGRFGETLVAALRGAGLSPDTFLAEYGNRQYEITIRPSTALIAADQGVITRELARATAHRLGHRAVFSPMPVPDGVGNGVHIHFSLWDAAGGPCTHDAAGPMGLSNAARHFCAGVLHHLPSICAVTAPSPVSYLRLTPNRWAPTAVDLVRQDRGAALRICPVFATSDPEQIARRFNVEFRVADAAASPYLALGAILFAGADGIRRGLMLPKPGQQEASLPASLGVALDLMQGSAAVQSWFGPTFLDAYLRHKRSEIGYVAGLSVPDLCARYADVY